MIFIVMIKVTLRDSIPFKDAIRKKLYIFLYFNFKAEESHLCNIPLFILNILFLQII